MSMPLSRAVAIALCSSIFFMSGQTVSAGERIPSGDELQKRCAKLEAVNRYFARKNAVTNEQKNQLLESVLASAGIDPGAPSSEWGLPWGTFGAVFNQAEHIKSYQDELGCP